MTATVIEELKTRAKEPKTANPENKINTFFRLVLLMKKLVIKTDINIPKDSDAL